MIICIHKKDALQIMAKNKQQSPNLTMQVESYEKNLVGYIYIYLELILYILNFNTLRRYTGSLRLHKQTSPFFAHKNMRNATVSSPIDGNVPKVCVKVIG